MGGRRSSFLLPRTLFIANEEGRPPARADAAASMPTAFHRRPQLVLARVLQVRLSLSSVRSSVRGRSLVVGERQVSIGGFGRRPGRAIRMLLVAQKSCKSLSLHHCLQESRHITRADRFSTFPLFSRYHHTTLHRHTDHLAHNWDVDQASGPSLALLVDIRK